MNAFGIGFSDIGKRRHTNEDALLVDNGLGLFVVADGMGGHAAGDVAAQTAVAAVEQYIGGQAHLLERIHTGYVHQKMLSSITVLAVLRACRTVYQRSMAEGRLRGMGCTLTVLLVGRDMAAMAHVGDSRLYLQRDDVLRQLSVDHTVAEDFVRSGLITAAEKSLIPQAHFLSRAVGVRDTVDVDEMLFEIHAGDRLVLCSDGVWGYMDDPKTMDEFLRNVPSKDAAEALVCFANSAGGRDNATALVVTIRDELDESDRRARTSTTSTTSDLVEHLSSYHSESHISYP